MQQKIISLITFSLLIVMAGQAQIASIDLDRIPQKKVRALFETQRKNQVKDIEDIPATCCEGGTDTLDFRTHEKSYLVEADLETVWQAYLNSSPAKSWKGKILSFALLYSESDKNLVYPDEEFSGITVGQRIFLNLRLFGGLVNVAVAHQIKEVDSVQKIIKSCYLSCGKSEGSQTIQLFATKEGHTKIVHHTYFRSDSSFRDKNLYPHFHQKVISEFHRNVNKDFGIKKL